MTFIGAAADWLDDNKEALIANGVAVHRAKSSGDHDKHSIHVSLELGGRFSEIIVWDSGEVERGYGAVSGDATDDHFVLTSPQELVPLLAMLRNVVLPDDKAK